MVKATITINYSISELETVTGLTRRTIHYYTKEKLIPPPDGAGGGSKYNDEHLVRLQLIKEMQKSHLKLSGIREALDAMTFIEMKSLYQKAQKGKISSWDPDAIENWLIDSSEPEETKSNISYQLKPMNKVSESSNYSFLSLSNKIRKKKKPKNVSYLKDLKRTTTPDASWERFNVLDGVEINIRSDIMKKYGMIIKSWIDNLKKLI
jgi:DNA-binding transcriptional MerR regulator|tara:strand:- start:1743 stop:2363 length:621 start_codon:yes stop_codon:yes gene_type:complete